MNDMELHTKNKKMKTTYILGFLTFFILMSCGDKFLSLSPKDTLTEENFYLNESDAQAGLNGAYGMLQREETFSNVRDAADVEWAIAGDMYEMDGSANRIELHTLAFPATNTILRDMYMGAYLGVSRANIVINKVSAMENIAEESKQLILGQAKFLRALFYYRLVTYWGGVPLITEILDASSNLEVSRASAEEVWALIESDLLAAKTALPKTWTGNNVGKATTGSALALLIKAALWQEKYEDAVGYGEELIQLGVHGLVPKFRDVFSEENENNEEILFSTQFRPSQDSEGNNLVKRTAPRGAPSEFTGGAAWSNFVPQQHWVNTFEKDDQGKIKDKRYWDVIIGPGEPHQNMPAFVMPNEVPTGWSKTGYIVTKYWEKPTINNSGINAPIMRFSEALLNYAEALNEIGRTSDAIVQINKVRERAGLDQLSAGLGKEETLDAIFKERRVEFIWESTGGFSDLNRRGRFIDFIRKERPNINDLNVDQKPWLHTRPIVFPIPREAWDRNKALEQNPNYTF